VGREDEVAAVRAHLQSSRLVTLTGPGGSGKTRLGVRIAREELGRFEDGGFFTDLASISDSNLIASSIASAVGMSLSALAAGSGSIQESLLGYLSDSRTLIVLDNCEHLLGAAAEICDQLLERCPNVTVLATSREALGVEGEQLFAVSPLGLPADGDPRSAESVRLFCDRAAAARSGFDVTEDTVQDVADICRHLDGIPLAIELAAAQVTHMSPRQIAERLDDRLSLLTGPRTRAKRQQTLAATLDWSHDLLSESEQVMLRRLSVFPGSFTREAAEAICGDDPIQRG